jgi:uncharacterized protein
MLVTSYTSAERFLAQTQDALLLNEASNSLILGISFRLKNQSEQFPMTPFLATVADEQGLIIAACMTPPNLLILYSHRPHEHQIALQTLIEHIQTQQIPLPGCVGPTQVSADFARLWQDTTGQSYKISTRERVFALTQVTPPIRVPGKLRLASSDDYDLLLAWYQAFVKEAHPGNPIQVEKIIFQKINNQEMFVWEDTSAHIVSMAAKTRPIINVISVGPVYTPPEERGKGYASNCVAALSQHLLDSGWKTCSLFTDLSNPTSNSIYQKLGYQPLEDFNEIVFEPV